MTYYVLSRIDSYDCSVHRFEDLTDALKMFLEYQGYGSNPILTQELEVNVTATSLPDEDRELHTVSVRMQ